MGASKEMKPLGTITKYFPFLEKEISTHLESIMYNSLNYSDFIDRVIAHVMENESSPMMVFFAVIHSDRIQKTKPLEMILQKYQNLPLLQPFIKRFELSTGESTTTDVLESAEEIAVTTQDSWVAFEMHKIRFLCSSTHSVGSTIEEDALKKLRTLTDSDPKMICFKPDVLGLIASRLYNEGKVNEALKYQELESTHAQSCDDIYKLSRSLLSQAYFLRNIDSKRAHEMIDKMREFGNILGFDTEEDWS